jgi:asparagine synthase (glutamine-hydrolysing)
VCGIYGELTTGEDVDPTSLARMGATLAHRGPDGDGHVIAGRVGLGCRRLAIIDVAGGAQPLANEDGSVLVVCNGEIYNHAALRRGLEARGHRFRTRSDAEVLPHLYEEQARTSCTSSTGCSGSPCGTRAAIVSCSRAPVGREAALLRRRPHGLSFASEAKALLASGRVAPEPDWSALAGYLATGYTSAPSSAFRDVAKLPPGGRLIADGESSQSTATGVSRRISPRTRSRTPEEAAFELRGHLERAVGLHW